MQSDPPGISSVIPEAPPALEQLARACLAKDQSERRQTMRDVLTDLKWIAGASSGSRPDIAKPIAPSSRLRPVRIWKAATGVLALVAVALAAAWWLRPVPEIPTTRFIIPAPEKSAFGLGLALSPDGKRLAFVAAPEGSQDLLWVRAMDSLTSQPITGSEGAQHPFWSPDSRSIAFFAQGKLKRIEIAGGTMQILSDAPDPRGGAWGPDGVILFAPDSVLPLQRMPATGGTPVAVTKLNAARVENSHRWPHFLPDGRHYLCFIYSQNPANNAIGLGSLDSQELRVLTRGDSAPVYSPPGWVLFARGSTLLAQSFSATKLSLKGEPFPVAQNVNLVGISTGPTGAIQSSVSANGTLAYQIGGATAEQLVWFDRAGKPLGNFGAPGTMNSPDISPDGKRVVVEGVADVWLLDTARGVPARFTFGGIGDNSPLWSPDGSQIVFTGVRGGKIGLYTKTTAGGAAEQVLFQSDVYLGVDDWSRDGRLIIYEARFQEQVRLVVAAALWRPQTRAIPADRIQ